MSIFVKFQLPLFCSLANIKVWNSFTDVNSKEKETYKKNNNNNFFPRTLCTPFVIVSKTALFDKTLRKFLSLTPKLVSGFTELFLGILSVC